MKLLKLGCISYTILLIPVSFWTDRTLEFWLTSIMNRQIDIPFYASFLVTAFTMPASITLNIISEFIRLFV